MLLAAAMAGLALGGCRSDRGTVSGCPPESRDAPPPVDANVTAFLSAARSLHHEADLQVRSGNAAGAIAALEKLVAMPRPATSEVDEVLADAYARLAEMRLEGDDWAGAEREVHAGLERAPEPTYFRGHLLEVSGVIEEQRAASLADAGKSAEAAQARARALERLESAVQVQQQVIARALADGGAPVIARHLLCALALSLSMCAAPPPEPAASPEPAAPPVDAPQVESPSAPRDSVEAAPVQSAPAHAAPAAAPAAPAPAADPASGESTADDKWAADEAAPSRAAQRADAQRALQRAEADLQASANDCATACRALASMSRAVTHLCGLADSTSDQQRCDDGKRRLTEAEERVRRACGACSR